jgi:hypothetical protein
MLPQVLLVLDKGKFYKAFCLHAHISISTHLCFIVPLPWYMVDRQVASHQGSEAQMLSFLRHQHLFAGSIFQLPTARGQAQGFFFRMQASF